MPLQVNERCREIDELHIEWLMIEGLMAGTRRMRFDRHRYMPKWPGETEEAYKARLDTATLFPAYRRTVGVMSGKPFAKPLQVKDAAPDITEWLDDIDLQGVSLHSFAAEMFHEAIAYGLCGILIDYPTIDGPMPTAAQLKANKIRPYWVRVKHNQILGWQADRVNGAVQLTQLRILEDYTEDDGPFGRISKQQVRVLTPGGWEIFRDLDGKGGPMQSWAKGTTTLPIIPFVPIYGVRDGYMIGRPPMLDLAYLNIKHWQSQSDQDTILHVARVPILAMIGADDQTQLTVGGSSAVKLPMGAEMKFVEHSGHAIAAGETSLQSLEQQMVQTGAELLIQKPGQRTATESSNDAEANKSDLQRMAENFADALDQALTITGQWVKQAQTGEVVLFDDYGAATMGEASAALMKDLHLSGIISGPTAISELQRRGVLSDSIDPESEYEIAKSEVPATPLEKPAEMSGSADLTVPANAG
jgi:hypothetical protein